MVVRISTAEARPALALRRVGPVVLMGILLLWIIVVLIGGASLALQAVGFPSPGESQPNFAPPSMVGAALLVYLSCLLAALISRRLWPTATLPATHAVGGIVVVAGAVGTGSVGPLTLALLLTALAWMLGNTLLHYLPSPPAAPVVLLPLAIALGLGLIGLLLHLLASLTMLNASTVLGGAGIVLIFLLVLNRERLRTDLIRLRGWRPSTPSWFESVVIGLAVGLLAFALLATFVPENTSDVIRQHLPIAREIWQTGSVAEFPPIPASRNPVQAHLLFALGYGLAGMTAAKLIGTVAGLTAVIGVAGLGWMCAGRVAATVGAAIFATLPHMLWTLGHAFPDLFAVMFAVAAALCILLWQRQGALVWLVVAGALAGIGLTTKQNLVLLIGAFAAALFLVGRRPWQLRQRIVAVMAFGLGTLVVVPWLIRTYDITGTLPGLFFIIDVVNRFVPGLAGPPNPLITDSGPLSNLHNVGVGDSPMDFVLSPWRLTFSGGPPRYDIIKNGEIGVLLLMLLPLAVLGPRTRAVALLAVTAAVSYLWWPLTYQVTRHLLPTLAMSAALCGIGVASAVTAGTTGPRRILSTAAQVGVLAGLIATPFYFLPNDTTRLPVNLFTGKETAADYVAREIPLAALLQAASLQFPPDTLVGYIGQWEGAQLYTEARLIFLGFYWEHDDRYLLDNQLGTTPEEVLDSLNRLGIRYFMWDRAATRVEDLRSTLLSTEFLRDHTRILAGDHAPGRIGYLFEIVPGNDTQWGEKRLKNLLDDPGLSRVGKRGGSWTTDGGRDRTRRSRLNGPDDEAIEGRQPNRGQEGSRGTRGIVKLSNKETLTQRISAPGGNPYLLVASGKCSVPGRRADLKLKWFDDRGVQIDMAAEKVLLGTQGNEQFLWDLAPERAVSVSVELNGSGCEFDNIEFYQLS